MIRKFLKNILGENFTENNAKLATVNAVWYYAVFPARTDFYFAYR